VVIKNSILYDGWRHFLFIYPPAIVLISLGWKYLIDKFEHQKKLRYAVWSLLALTSIDSIAFLVRNSTFPYTYFNPLVGGIKGAHGEYELDYWGASVKQGVEWLEKEGIISEDMTDTIYIASNFSHVLSIYTKKYEGKVRTVYVRWRQRFDKEWDYSLFVNRFVDGSYIRGGYWPTQKAIHTIESNGVPILMIEREDPAKNAFLGSTAIKQKQWEQAIFYLDKELEKYPNNELALVGKGMAYLNMNQPQQAKAPLDRALTITPENQNALNFSGYYHFVQGNYPLAKEVFLKAGRLHSTNATAFYYLGRMEMTNQNYVQALQHVRECIDANGRFRECYSMAAQIYDQMGDAQRAQIYRDALQQL
jgi:Tfp pilus assembly protein PilF